MRSGWKVGECAARIQCTREHMSTLAVCIYSGGQPRPRPQFRSFCYPLVARVLPIAMHFSPTLQIILFLSLRSTMDSKAEELITVTEWGTVDGRSVQKYTLKNKASEEVDIVTYGATITSIRVLDKHNNLADVVLGFDNVQDYSCRERNPYLGATIGRVANRIKGGEFVLNGKIYRLARNAGQNTLHGGLKGWDTKIWNATVEKDHVVLSLLSEDGDEGFPGAVIASVSYRFTDDGELRVIMKVMVTKPCPINLTNHSYFNLAGHTGNANELYKHRFTLHADRWTVTDANSIPTGEIRSVNGTAMDLTKPTTLGDVIEKVEGAGYDYNFCLTRDNVSDSDEIKLVAEATHPASGRYMQVFSDQPGVQFYTANYFPEQGSAGIRGKNGSSYFKHAAFCLETQNYPDAIHHDNFPNSVLQPGEIYRHAVTYKFGVIG